MSATIRCSCAGCGTVDVPLADATLLLGGGGVAGHVNQLEFVCGRCRVTRVQDADERATRLLSGAGIVVAVRAQPETDAAFDVAGRDRPVT